MPATAATSTPPMTWHNLPCAPTLPALFAACPNGWVELVVSNHNGSPTADPPQDASRGIEIGRMYGVENSDVGAVVDLMADIDEDGMPVGYPRGDCVLLVRIDHNSERCGECDRPRPEDHRGPLCHPGYSQDGGCSGSFIAATTASALWGEGGKAVYCDGNDAPAYTTVNSREKQPPPQPGVGDMWQQVIDRYEDSNPSRRVWDLFRKRREMGLTKYGTPLQAGNGRNPLRDLLDETLDRIVYIEQAITEQPGRAASLRTEQDNDVEFVEVLLGMQGFEDTGEQCRAAYLRSIGETDQMRAAAAAIGVDPDRATVPEVAATINAVYSDEPVLCDFCKKPYESTRAHRLGLCTG